MKQRPRCCKYLSTLLHRRISCNQGTARMSGFYNYRGKTEPRQSSVAPWKMPSMGSHPRTELAEQRTLSCHFFCQPVMFTGIYAIHACGHNRESLATTAQRTTVSGGINATSQAADHKKSSRRQLIANLISQFQAISRRASSTNNGNCMTA